MSDRYYTARVVDNNDPEQRGRLQLEIAGLLDTEDGDAIWPDWVDPRIAGGVGAGSVGLLWVPPNDSIVIVELEIGGGAIPDLRWMGSSPGNVATLPGFLLGNYPRRAGTSSPTGTSLIAFDDDAGIFLLVDHDELDTKGYLTIKRDGTAQLGTADGTTVLLDKRKIVLMTSADGGADTNHLISLDEETGQIAIVHQGGTEFLFLEDGVIKINGTAIQIGGGTIELSDGAAPALNPYLLTLAFFADLSLVLPEIVALGLSAFPSPIPTPNTTSMIGKLATSLSAGAPYLSTIVSGN